MDHFYPLLSSMHLGHDIWYQVVQFLECSVEDNSVEAAERRATLLNIALTSQELSTLALAMLWKNMSSLQPIVDVINSSAFAPEELFLVRIEKSEGYWKLLRRPDDDRIASRVKDYLGHIRSFLVRGDEQESTLWPILIACFGKEKPLLPNVKDLVAFFNSDFPASYNLLPLILPPKLKTIETLQTEGSDCLTAMSNFYQLLSGCCLLQKVEYDGDFCPNLIPTFTSFKNLESLTVSYEREISGGRTSPLSLPELLQQLPSLKYLSVDLATLATCTATSGPPLEHHSLQLLSLNGIARVFYSFFASGIICPLVQTFTLEIRPNRSWLSWKLLFDGMVSIFPALLNLRLEAPDVHCPPLVMSDLKNLLSLPMEEFVAWQVRTVLTQEDLQAMAKAWPSLRELRLPGCETCVAITTVLSESWSSEIHELELCLDFTTFTSPHRDLPVTQKAKLQDLTVHPSAKLPPTFNGKVRLARNLLTVCPNLKTVWTVGSEAGREAMELQGILDGLRDVVATHRESM